MLHLYWLVIAAIVIPMECKPAPEEATTTIKPTLDMFQKLELYVSSCERDIDAYLAGTVATCASPVSPAEGIAPCKCPEGQLLLIPGSDVCTTAESEDCKTIRTHYGKVCGRCEEVHDHNKFDYEEYPKN